MEFHGIMEWNQPLIIIGCILLLYTIVAVSTNLDSVVEYIRSRLPRTQSAYSAPQLVERHNTEYCIHSYESMLESAVPYFPTVQLRSTPVRTVLLTT